MQCFYCKQEFEVKVRRGGHNRLFCYNCLPDGLLKQERDEVKRKLLQDLANQEKKKIGCCRCGYNKCASALEWHHDNDDKKKFNPSDRLKDGTITAYQDYRAEIIKCSLYCANCHREIHNPT